MSARNTVHESSRLGHSENGWTLRGSSATAPSSRTRNGGLGRPNLERREYYNEASTAVESSDEEESCYSEGEWNEELESSSEEEDDEWKAPERTEAYCHSVHSQTGADKELHREVQSLPRLQWTSGNACEDYLPCIQSFYLLQG